MDAPGLQSAGSSLENPVSGSLEDLIFNYLQERLQLMFHHTAFTTMKDRYKQVCSCFLCIRIVRLHTQDLICNLTLLHSFLNLFLVKSSSYMNFVIHISIFIKGKYRIRV